jgi:uncharacterized protein YyaL (SSP411 family)
MTSPKSPHVANRLRNETSPYLLQHAHNPVDWYPWGEEAFARARDEAKPVFLSVGYSACHWCHVMERESFESPQIAALLNEHFINIKVDREERPDVDQIYMASVQALSGHGGWPMSVFMTPDAKPFYAGTYFPPDDGRGMPGFRRVISAVADAWRDRRDEILNGAGRVTQELQSLGGGPTERGDLDARLLDHAFTSLERLYDSRHGGFGDAPKFPHPMDVKVLLRHAARTGDASAMHMARHSLEKMARGGIYDHLGGGFARYSTDSYWLVPHFEKMLYDNAMLASAYLEAAQLTGSREFKCVARETLDYVLTRMTGPEGCVHATEDADSEGVEGKYYVWTLEEITEVLGEDRTKTFAQVYDVTSAGNWEHKNILNLPRPLDEAAKLLGMEPTALEAELSLSRGKLLAARQQRIAPHKDTKVIVAWNGMMIAAWAQGARTLKDPRYLEAARGAAAFILDHMRCEDGRLWHSWKDQRAHVYAFLDDYACFIDGLTRLFECSAEARWLEAAIQLAEVMIDEFADPREPGFFYTGRRAPALIVRAKDPMDNATPSGNAMAATALARLAAITGEDRFETAALNALQSARALMLRAPSAMGQSFIALDFLLGEREEIALFASEDEELRLALEAIAQRFSPHSVLAPVHGELKPHAASHIPIWENRNAKDRVVTAYVCRGFACSTPLVGLPDIEKAFRSKRPQTPV